MLGDTTHGDTTQGDEQGDDPADSSGGGPTDEPGDGSGGGRPGDAAPTRPGALPVETDRQQTPPAEILLLDVPSPPSVGATGGAAGGAAGGGGGGGGGPAGTPALGLRASRSVLRLTQAVGRHRERTVGRES